MISHFVGVSIQFVCHENREMILNWLVSRVFEKLMATMLDEVVLWEWFNARALFKLINVECYLGRPTNNAISPIPRSAVSPSHPVSSFNSSNGKSCTPAQKWVNRSVEMELQFNCSFIRLCFFVFETLQDRKKPIRVRWKRILIWCGGLCANGSSIY